jgi:hypothetical protein
MQSVATFSQCQRSLLLYSDRPLQRALKFLAFFGVDHYLDRFLFMT